MNKELETLLGFHAALGGSAIILSATLPTVKRHALIDPFHNSLGSGERWSSCISAYPLVTIAAVRRLRNIQFACDSRSRVQFPSVALVIWPLSPPPCWRGRA